MDRVSLDDVLRSLRINLVLSLCMTHSKCAVVLGFLRLYTFLGQRCGVHDRLGKAFAELLFESMVDCWR